KGQVMKLVGDERRRRVPALTDHTMDTTAYAKAAAVGRSYAKRRMGLSIVNTMGPLNQADPYARATPIVTACVTGRSRSASNATAARMIAPWIARSQYAL